MYPNFRASLVAQGVKNLPAMQETWIWSLDQEDPLGKGFNVNIEVLGNTKINTLLFEKHLFYSFEAIYNQVINKWRIDIHFICFLRKTLSY